MPPQLPPPDPYESPGSAPSDGFALPGPTAVFLCGRPSAQTERVCDAILSVRPGALIVLVPE